MREDFAENHNVAGQNRAKLIEMIAMWYVEAGKYKCYAHKISRRPVICR